MASSGAVDKAEPPSAAFSHPLARVLHPVAVAALQRSEPTMYSCTAEVSWSDRVAVSSCQFHEILDAPDV